jgi:hypothetical protein
MCFIYDCYITPIHNPYKIKGKVMTSGKSVSGRCMMECILNLILDVWEWSDSCFSGLGYVLKDKSVHLS